MTSQLPNGLIFNVKTRDKDPCCLNVHQQFEITIENIASY